MLVDGEDGVTFTRAALALLGDPQRRIGMGTAARESVRGFGWDDVVQRFESVLMQAIDRQPEGRYAASAVRSNLAGNAPARPTAT